MNATSNDDGMPWPELPISKFISGRVADESDIDRGDAVFVSRIDGALCGAPAPITIPQYAELVDEDGSRIPVVVVQAEVNELGTFVGLRDARGKEYVVTEPEVILLGRSHP
jgi:hypothetical protein